MKVSATLGYNPIAWNQPQGANLYSTGASGLIPVRPAHPVNPVESVDKIGEGVIVSIRNPERPTDRSVNDLDWTAKQDNPEKSFKQVAQEQVQEKEPLFKQIVGFVQSIWRPSLVAVEAQEQASKTELFQRNAEVIPRDQPLVYEDPRVKRSGGVFF